MSLFEKLQRRLAILIGQSQSAKTAAVAASGLSNNQMLPIGGDYNSVLCASLYSLHSAPRVLLCDH